MFASNRRGLSGRWTLAIAGLLLLTALFAAARHRLAEGLVLPIRISESSMAPYLKGEHWQFDCAQCGATIDVDALPDAAETEVTCRRCGNCSTDRRNARSVPGDRVLIDRWALTTRNPRRWEVLAVVDPASPHRQMVKRCVALPGEQVELRQGDVIVNGATARKVAPQRRQLAIEVARFDPDIRTAEGQLGSAAIPWVTGDHSDWHLTDQGLVFDRGTDVPQVPNLSWDWCEFRSVDDPEDNVVLDDLTFNTEVSRTLNVVTDLWLDGEVQPNAPRLGLRLTFESDEWMVDWSLMRGQFELRRNGELTDRAHVTPDWQMSPRRFSIGQCDRQFFVEIDRQTLFAIDLTEDRQTPAGSPRLAIGAIEGGVTVSRLEVWRDTYYLPVIGHQRYELPATLGESEYFLLGDNSPVSLDSRYRRIGPWSRQDCLGTVRPWFVERDEVIRSRERISRRAMLSEPAIAKARAK